MNEVMIPVSIGELFDKITILEIKKEKITDPNKIKNICNELTQLKKISLVVNQDDIEQHIYNLKKINNELWKIEDKKRDKEKEKQFDSEFIELARAVYINNDKRADIKKQINLITKSSIVEEKSYEESSCNT